MKKFAIIFMLICMIGVAAVLIFSKKETDVLLNSGDVENVKHIITSECNNNVVSISLLGGKESSPCVRINYHDNSPRYFYLDGKNRGKPNDSEVIVTIKEFDDAAEKLCGLYNGYYIMKSNAERELGRLDGFWYGNFDTANDNYEAIAIIDGELFLAEDDCVRHISGVLFDFSDEIEEGDTDE